jgi:hypothetical protein
MDKLLFSIRPGCFNLGQPFRIMQKASPKLRQGFMMPHDGSPKSQQAFMMIMMPSPKLRQAFTMIVTAPRNRSKLS